MSTEFDTQTQELPTHMSEALDNLREAYKHAAVAKALIDIEPENDPRLLTITDGIISIISQIDGVTVEPIDSPALGPFIADKEAVSVNGNGNGNGNGHRDDTQVISRSDQIIPDETNDSTDTLEPETGSESASGEIVESTALAEPTEPNATMGNPASNEQTVPGESTERDRSLPVLATPIERDSDVTPEVTIDIIGDNTLSINGSVISLSPYQVTVLSSLLINRNKLTPTTILNPEKHKSYSDTLWKLTKKLTEAGIDGVQFLLKEGDRRFTKWQINPIFDIQDIRDVTTAPETEQVDTAISAIGNLAVDGAQQADDGAPEVSAESDTELHESASTPEVVEPPKLTILEDLGSAKERRKGIVTITNLEQLNEWVDTKNPYNDLPRLEIVADNKVLVNGKEQSLSPDQVEMLNILLSAYGASLTQSQIIGSGFAEFLTSGKRIDTFRSSFNRLHSLFIDDERHPLVQGDLLNQKGFKCSELMRIVDTRPEVKKK